MGFTKQDIEYAQEVQKKYGVPASVTLAQYAYESGYGTSNLAKQNKNYFGMRNGSEGWQKFSSKKESFMAYGELLSSELYASKTAGAETVSEYVNAIAETYAPASDGNNNYAANIMKIIDGADLTQYDTVTPSGGGGSTSGTGAGRRTDSASTLGLVWWGDIVKVVFCILVICGGVAFLGLAVVNTSAGDGIVNNITRAVKGGKKND